jgi:hypothetical protein
VLPREAPLADMTLPLFTESVTVEDYVQGGASE